MVIQQYENIDASKMKAEECIRIFVELRDSLAAEKKAFDAVEKQYESVMDAIQMRLRDIADDMGVDQLSSREFGTAFRVTKESYRVGNWNEFIEWVKAKNAFHCIEKRCAKLAIKEVQEVDGAIPPGIDYHAEIEMQVRRPSK